MGFIFSKQKSESNLFKKFLSILIFLFSAVLFIYARWVEPLWIDVTHHFRQANLPSNIKIAHISDLHIRELGKRESKILDLIDKEKPDVILITGDSVAENSNYNAVDAFFEKLTAPLGVWSVNGNWEHWRPREVVEPKENLLVNTAKELTKGVWLIGLDDQLAGDPNLKVALKKVPPDAFKIGLLHSPSFFDQAYPHLDLVLAGHTHGGQIRLPFLPPLWLPSGSGRFVAGWYQNEDSMMYVSRGLGNSIADIRFMARPELAIINLGPQNPLAP